MKGSTATRPAISGEPTAGNLQTAPKIPPRAFYHSLLPRLLAILFGLALVLLVAEVALRVAGPKLASPRLPLSYDRGAIDEIAAGRAYMLFDADLGWRPTPGADRTADRVRYRHNQAGLRAEREYALAPPAGVTRYAAFGDSYTYCYEVDLDDCWTDLLERALPNSEVLNYGVPGYGPDQAWLRYQRSGADMRPCAVLIGHFLGDIKRVVNRFRPFLESRTGIPLAKPRYVLEDGRPVLLPSPARTPDPLKDPAWVEANLGPRDAWYFPGIFVANPFDPLEVVRLARTASYRKSPQADTDWTPTWTERMYRPGSEPFEVTVAVLAGFAEQVRVDGFAPVVLVLPGLGELAGPPEGQPKQHEALLQALRQRDVPTLDLTDSFAEQARRSGPRGLTLTEHYSPRGNAVVARALAAELPALTAGSCEP